MKESTGPNIDAVEVRVERRGWSNGTGSSLLENAPMLAINRRLGYRPGVRAQEISRDLGESLCR
jgi:hypothetical protein